MILSPSSPWTPVRLPQLPQKCLFFPFWLRIMFRNNPHFFFFFLVFSNPEQFFILSLPLTSSHIFESTFHRATLKLYPTSVSSRSDSCHEFLAGMLQKWCCILSDNIRLCDSDFSHHGWCSPSSAGHVAVCWLSLLWNNYFPFVID